MHKERIKAILNNHFRSYGMTYELRLEDELEAFAREIRNEALEEAAKESENYPEMARDLYHETDKVICNVSDDITKRIRNMKQIHAEQASIQGSKGD